jgi:hypothetical protein
MMWQHASCGMNTNGVPRSSAQPRVARSSECPHSAIDSAIGRVVAVHVRDMPIMPCASASALARVANGGGDGAIVVPR